MKNVTVTIEISETKGARFVADGGGVFGTWREAQSLAIEDAINYETKYKILRTARKRNV